ncbi:hypothetical protein [Neobacillus cucumis]|uniref:Core-binding (CB) domain-containing protein n=1 Tax=Neobacillus cucumis TaxID=1740721 RepID=A0A2N5HGZ2_9BACI|nr:hypothetical protein [Neobacillus cucumis]PLS04780.1 hypothetical protein CVD27_11020 [Neobacillus cucumis]
MKRRRLFYGRTKQKKWKKDGIQLLFEEEVKSPKTGKSLIDLFETFMRAKELEGLRPRTLKEHRTTFKYFLSFLNQKNPSIECADEITTEIIRDLFLLYE